MKADQKTINQERERERCLDEAAQLIFWGVCEGFGESNWNLAAKVKGWPALHALASLCLWLLDDGVRMGLFQLWCRHGTAPMHIIAFQFIFQSGKAVPLTSTCILSDDAVCKSSLETEILKSGFWWRLHRTIFWDDYYCYDDNDDNWSTHHLKRMT